MRTLLVKFAGLALYIHELQSSTLVLTHARPNKEPRVHKVYREDFEDAADELEAEALGELEPGIEASVEGLSLRLIKNDGVLNIAYEGKDGEVVEWKFQGLTSMMASASTQTVSEAQSKLSTSTIRTVATDPTPQRMIWPSQSELSGISTIETRPIETPFKGEEEAPARAATGAGENELKRKATQDMERAFPHKRAKSSHNSPPWPNHLYMTCFRTQPISKSDIGTLHIDLVEGTAWFEGWHGKEDTRVFERKQINLRCHSTDCSAPGWQTWGSDTDTSPGPNPALTAKEWIKVREAGMINNIPRSRPTWTSTHILPSKIVDALVHCVDRASRHQAVHDPDVDHELEEQWDRFASLEATGRLTTNDMDKWRFTTEESGKRKALKRTFRTVE
ncbi:hypothetical protein J4E82_005668 [Alternaria postmessia]|uniref:uncharacterized protein n=1 Tax=Alternaria postmessia TaxID=1187938 RepID=UPI002225295F|nr:uncharacterized protein J4E82_005668 [Alternaria postmessia]KAI5375716.1 hypothetical protein J4E82_005668 [Alternaria postmessia]